ncbi:MAG: ABC transporter permease [Rikenellaceae bacterium]
MKRELKRMISRPMYFLLTVGIMTFCYVFFLSFFYEGQLTKMPVGVVDLDNSSISRQFVQNLNTTQQVEVVMKLNSYREARIEMQKGNIYAFVEIKHGFAKEVQSNRRPTLTFYINDAYLTAGSLLLKDISTMSALTSGSIQRQVLRAKGLDESKIMGIIQPISLDTHLIGNPWANYGSYFLNVFFPGILELMVLMTTVFVIGVELKERTSREWLHAADNRFSIALIGKLLPYTIIFTILGFISNFILYYCMHYPLNSSIGWMLLATVFYVIACQSIGILIIGLMPVLRDSVSLVTFYGMFGFTFTGFTFPIEQMPYPVQIFSELYPIRHYFNIYINQALHGVDIKYSILSFFVLLSFNILPFFVFYRLKKAAIYQNFPIK